MRPTARERFDRLDLAIRGALVRWSVPVVRTSLGVVFLWFGVLKFFPELSAAEGMAMRTVERLTFGLVGPDVSRPVLAGWESLIGLGLLTDRMLRTTLFLLALQMLGTLTPLVLFPEETFVHVPYAPTLEGQYILKNVVLIGAAMVVGATVGGGRLVGSAASKGARRRAG